MQASEEQIVQVVVEIMSQRQFHFDEPGCNCIPWEFAYLGYILLGVVLCVVFAGLYYGLKDKYKRPEKKKPIPPPDVLTKANEALLPPIHQIDKLFMVFLNSLQERKLVSLCHWKTNADYVKESANPLLQKICVFYDAAIYGNKEIPPETVMFLTEAFADWEKQP